MEIIFFLTLLAYLFLLGSFTDFADYDFFARLIVGKTYFQTGDVLKYDFLSYSNTHPWYDHEWGASLIFYFIQDRFGDIGLLFFKTFCLFITFYFLILIIKLRRKILKPDEKFPIFNFLFFLFALQPLHTLIFSLRCHHFTFMFFAIWLYVLEKARLEKNYRILWVLPLLMIVWSNIHGGCFMGLGITGLYIIGEFIGKKPFLPYVYTFLASFGLMIINPYGIDYVKFLVKATTMSRPNIIEWFSPFSKYFITKHIKFKIILLLFSTLYLYKGIKNFIETKKETKFDKIKEIWKNTDKTKFFLLLIMFLLTVKSMRFITYFMFVVIPFCYDDFYSIFSRKLKEKYNRIKELILFGIISIVLALNLITTDLSYQNFHTIFPIGEIQFLIDNNVKGNLYVPFETGSYTAYKLYPNNFILLDGRYEEVYDIKLNDIYAKTVSLGALGWRDMLDSIHHDSIIAYKNNAMYENLKTHPDYYLIQESKTFALFIRKNVYKKIKRPVKIPTNDSKFYKKTLWDTNIDWMKK